MSQVFRILGLFVVGSAFASWDTTLNTCNSTQTLIKSMSYTVTQTTDDCQEFCYDQIQEYSVANPSDYSNQDFCCEYTKIAADRNAAYSWDYTCKNYLNDIRYDQFASTCTDVTGSDSQGNTCSWYTDNSGDCGSYDVSRGFTAGTNCCACRGGTTVAGNTKNSNDVYESRSISWSETVKATLKESMQAKRLMASSLASFALVYFEII